MTGKKLTLYLVLVAAFTAVNFLITFLLPIPGLFGVGYINFGDAVIFIGSCMLGPLGGLVIGGIGSAIADVFAGYAVYAPFTLVIKGLEGFLCGALHNKLFCSIKRPLPKVLLSSSIASLVMIFGYFLADWIIYGSAYTAATNNFVGGPIQAIVSIIIACVAMPKTYELFFKHDRSTTTNSPKNGDTDIDEKG